MIRCIYIGDQIVDGGTSFAFYDTVTDEFVDLGRGAVWDSFEEFDEDCRACNTDPAYAARLRRLIPRHGVPRSMSKTDV